APGPSCAARARSPRRCAVRGWTAPGAGGSRGASPPPGTAGSPRRRRPPDGGWRRWRMRRCPMRAGRPGRGNARSASTAWAAPRRGDGCQQGSRWRRRRADGTRRCAAAPGRMAGHDLQWPPCRPSPAGIRAAMPELALQLLLLLFLAGLLAGFIDLIAGGGGMVTIPAMLLVGIPPLQTLGTNKLQSLVGAGSASLTYGRHGHVARR